jgi:hypothetical protein
MAEDVPPYELSGVSSMFEGSFAPANFQDAEDSRPSGVHVESLGGSHDPIQNIVQQTITRHLLEGMPHASPSTTNTNWRKRLREMMLRQNESVLAFLYKPAAEHAIVGPVEHALRRYAIRQDIEVGAIRTFKHLIEDISGFQGEIDARIQLKGPSTSKQLRAQTLSLIDFYKETGEKLLECESQLKQRLEKMDKIQKKVSSIMELQTNEATSELVNSLEKYLTISFKDSGIESEYKNLLLLYKKHMILREEIQIFKNSQTVSEPLCAICITDPVAMTISPCGHTFCQTCSRRMVTECGICRGRIKDRIKLFFC